MQVVWIEIACGQLSAASGYQGRGKRRMAKKRPEMPVYPRQRYPSSSRRIARKEPHEAREVAAAEALRPLQSNHL